MTPEKATMANMSGGKRDRGSDHTDQPITTPNSRDNKLLCSVDKAAIGKEKDQAIIEIDSSKYFDSSKDGYETAVIPFAGSEVIDVDKVNSLVSSGGLEKYARESDMEEHVPYSLFDKFEDATSDAVDQGSPTGSPTAKEDHHKHTDNPGPNSNLINTNDNYKEQKNTSNKKNTNDNKARDDGKDATAVLILPEEHTKLWMQTPNKLCLIYTLTRNPSNSTCLP